MQAALLATLAVAVIFSLPIASGRKLSWQQHDQQQKQKEQGTSSGLLDSLMRAKNAFKRHLQGIVSAPAPAQVPHEVPLIGHLNSPTAPQPATGHLPETWCRTGQRSQWWQQWQHWEQRQQQKGKGPLPSTFCW